jgi:glycosyltransferase involved in cell wall biosynthesis
MDLRIGFVCSEYFHSDEINGKLKPSNAHGGFGFLTRVKAEYLAEHGYDVHVFIPGENFQNNIMETKIINKVQVHIYRTNYDKRSFIGKAIRQIKGLTPNPDLEKYFKEIKLDILQSEDMPPANILFNKSLNIPFILVFQDPWDYYDVNLLYDSDQNYLNIPKSGILGYEVKPQDYKFKYAFLINMVHKKNNIKPMHRFLTSNNKIINNYAEAKFIANKAKEIFNLDKIPGLLLNPIKMYNIKREKFENPTICWVGRWDPQKRPDMALLIARKMPDINFIMIGTASKNSKNYQEVEDYLKKEFSQLKNLTIMGFISEEKKREIIGKSWGLLNTSIREGLPITFLEAMAEGTPIISYVDPDMYTSRFGIKVDYNIDSFKQGIEKAVTEKLYDKIGNKEREYVLKEHELEVVMNKHLQIYEKILKNQDF